MDVFKNKEAIIVIKSETNLKKIKSGIKPLIGNLNKF